MDPRDPRNNEAGRAPETSAQDTLKGVYVYQPKDAADQPTGEKKFLEAREAAHAEAFLRVGYRLATEDEAKEYRKRVEEGKTQARQELLKDESERREALTGATGQTPTESEVKENKTDKEVPESNQDNKSKDSKKETK